MAVEAMVVTAEEVVLEAKSLRPQPHLVRQNRPNRFAPVESSRRLYRKRDSEDWRRQDVMPMAVLTVGMMAAAYY